MGIRKTFVSPFTGGVKLWFFIAYYWFSFGAIFMPVNIAERPNLVKEMFDFLNVCLQM